MSVSSTNPYASYGISGLASGINTEDMVKKLLSGTQTKLDSQYAKRQQLQWKQDIYRDIISDFRSFQTKFYSYSNPKTNMLSNSFYNSMASSASSSAVKVNPSSSATAGKVTIDSISKLATAIKKTSGFTVSGEIIGETAVDLDKLHIAETATIKIDGVAKEVKLDCASNDTLVKSINDGLAGLGTAELKDGKITIKSTDAGKTIEISGSEKALSILGLKETTKSDTGEISLAHDLSKGVPELKINMDGVERTVKIDFAYSDLNNFTTELNKKITKTMGNGITASVEGGKIKFVAESGRQITITGGSALEGLGLKKGISNKIDLNTNLGNVNFANALQGGSFVFRINGTKITAEKSESLKSIMDKVNNSDAGVTMSYSSSQDKFVIESKTMGAGVDIEMEQDAGNLLTVMFGTKNSGNVVGKQLKTDLVANDAFPTDFKGGKFTFEVNGSKVSLTVPEKADKSAYSLDELVSSLNGSISQSIVQFSNKGGKLAISSGDGFNVSMPSVLDSDNSASIFGFTSDQNQSVKGTTSLSDLGMSGKLSITLNSGATGEKTVDIDLDTLTDINSLATKVQETIDNGGASQANGKFSFDETSGGFILMGVKIPIKLAGADDLGNASLEKIFGSSNMTVNPPEDKYAVAMKVEPGQNAILSVNGVALEKNTNNFTMDGLDIELTGESQQAVTIDTTRDTEQVYKGIEEFVTEYNKMIEKVNGLIHEKAEYKDYAPLTDEQKKDMTEDQIKLWEEKAKRGLIRSDSVVSGVLTEMRNLLYSKPGGSSIALYDLGIQTSPEYKDYGKLVISDPAKLKNMIETKSSNIEKLFTAEDGLASKMNRTIDKAAKASSASPGSLVALAGIKGGTLDTTNRITNQLKDINDTIKNIKKKYETEKTRYWKQFNSMEKLISRMNSQSSWLSQQFA